MGYLPKPSSPAPQTNHFIGMLYPLGQLFHGSFLHYLQVQDNVGPAKHMTRSHQQPFHNNCESVDLWAAGIILLDMLLISSVGQMFKVLLYLGLPQCCVS